MLLVDANKGVQAQTVANFFLAFTSELAIVSAVNKIDLKNADPQRAIAQMERLFDCDPDKVCQVSVVLMAGGWVHCRSCRSVHPRGTASMRELNSCRVFKDEDVLYSRGKLHSIRHNAACFLDVFRLFSFCVLVVLLNYLFATLAKQF